MRYFVTGGTGFVGRALVRQLLAGGHEVVALARSAAKGRSLARPGVAIHSGDVTDRESMRAGMAGADGVFHVAGWYKVGVKDTRAAHAVNVLGTRNVLELMEELGIPRGVYTSTLAVFSDTRGEMRDESYRHDGPWLSVYDETKWRAHHEVAEPFQRRGLPLVILQPGLVYGPGDEGPLRPIWNRYFEGKLRAIPKTVAYCWGHVEDTAKGHVLAMEKGRLGESYILAGPPHTLVEAFAIAERVTGIRAPRFHIGRGFLRFLAAVTRSETYRVAAGVTYLGDSSKARRELGFAPRPLAEGLAETLRSEMERRGLPQKAS